MRYVEHDDGGGGDGDDVEDTDHRMKSEQPFFDQSFFSCFDYHSTNSLQRYHCVHEDDEQSLPIASQSR